MNEKEKSRPGAATPERDKGIKDESMTSTFNYYDTIIRKEHQGPVSAFLKKGAENALSTAELVQLVGCSTPRRLQMLVSSERENGVLILSSTSGGYFLPDDGEKGRQEIQRFVDQLWARAINTLRAAAAAKRQLRILEGQVKIQ
ncbi:MAG: hypothetical protein ACI4P4_10845 [Faecousia sp.]